MWFPIGSESSSSPASTTAGSRMPNRHLGCDCSENPGKIQRNEQKSSQRFIVVSSFFLLVKFFSSSIFKNCSFFLSPLRAQNFGKLAYSHLATMSGGYRSGMGDRPGGWAGQAIVKRSNAPNGMEVGIDFPFVCETCLGPNPYVRMVKMPPGDKLCKISNRGFQSFRWRAGPGGRWKETMIEYTVAKDKNLCQACLVDMTFGVPAVPRGFLTYM